ncbi:sulfatase [Opitutaceae bacterium]|nr:sulfatase [Opitutaceae bacterium]
MKYLRFSFFVFVSTHAIAAAALAQVAKPNLLLFLSDDLTYHDIGCYGNKEIRTPHIDQLAEEGLRFEYCFNSAPMCAPTRMSLYTGIHPVRNGAHPNHSRVHDHIQSMAHYLRPLGYRVGLMGKRHEAPIENFPFEFLGGQHGDRGGGIDLDLTLMDTFIQEAGDKPWCLVVASNQPHTPWSRGDPSIYDAETLTLPPYLVDTPETRENLTRYYAEITYMDNQVSQCLEYLDAHGESDETMVVYLSEQGSNFPHCKWTCYDTGLRSAAVVRWPGVIKPGMETKAMIQYIDVLPTFIEAAGGEPTSFDFDGRSFLDVLKGEADSHRNYTFGVQTSKGIYSGPEPEGYAIRTVRDERYRLVWNLNWDRKFSNTVVTRMEAYHSWKTKGEQGDAFALQRFEHYQRRPEFELYDLQNDPYEIENLAGKPVYGPTQVRLKEQLVAWMKQQGDQGKRTEFDALSRKGVHDTKPPSSSP